MITGASDPALGRGRGDDPRLAVSFEGLQDQRRAACGAVVEERVEVVAALGEVGGGGAGGEHAAVCAAEEPLASGQLSVLTGGAFEHTADAIVEGVGEQGVGIESDLDAAVAVVGKQPSIKVQLRDSLLHA